MTFNLSQTSKKCILLTFVLLLFVFSSFIVIGEGDAGSDVSSGESSESSESESSSGNVEESNDQESSDTGDPEGDSGGESSESSESESSSGNVEEVESETEEGTEDVEYIDLEEIIEEEAESNEEESLDNRSEEVEYIDLEEIIEEETNSTEEGESESSSGNGGSQDNVESGTKQEENAEGNGEEYAYINITEVVGEEAEKEENNEEKEQVLQVFYKDNKKEIEIETEKNKELEITKEEDVIEDKEEVWRKEVVVSSEEHVEDALRVYSDVEEGVEAGEIKVYWEEEDRFVSFDEIDSDDNGLTDRISWIVPHLSIQTFEIIVSFDSSSGGSNVDINVLSSPSGTISVGSVDFGFNVSYVTPGDLDCDLVIKKGGSDIVNSGVNSSGLYYNISLENGDYDWNFDCLVSSNNSINDSETGSFTIDVEYTPDIDFTVEDSSVTEGQAAKFNVLIESPINHSIIYILDVGDGSSLVNSGLLNASTVNVNISHAYDDSGSYTAKLTVLVDGTPTEKEISMSVSALVTEDTDDPEIVLIDPEDDAEVIEDLVEFSYNASDNVKVDNCTFNLYYYNESLLGSLVYTKLNSDIDNGEIVELELTDFDEGDYSWEVECYDNSTNYRSRDRDFEVNFSGDGISGLSLSDSDKKTVQTIDKQYEEEDEVEELLQRINDFLIAEEDFGLEEREIVESLGYLDSLDHYKKKLLQIRIDLQHNIAYINTQAKKDTRLAEIRADLDEIRENTILNVEVINSKEYTKNSVDFNMEAIVDAYVESKGFVLSGGEKKKLEENNLDLQKDISVLVKAMQAEFETEDGKEKKTVIIKEITVKNESFDSVIEFIPDELTEEEVKFENAANVLEEGRIFEIDLNDLEEGEIIYTIDEFVDLDDIEKTDSVAFSETAEGKGLFSITGFAILGDNEQGVLFYLSWAVVFVILAILIIIGVRKASLNKLKKDEKVREMFGIVKKAEQELKAGNTEVARDYYHRAKVIYHSEVPEKCKKIVYKRLSKVYVEIDKRDAKNLMKEFMQSIKAGDDNRALEIYDDIQLIYARMPKQYKKRVYDKITPEIRRLKAKRSRPY